MLPTSESRAAAARLDLPPPASARAELAESFGRRFLLFIDTEEEFDWYAPLRRDATATATLRALPEAQRRFHGFGIVPTYMIDHPVCTDPRSREALGVAVDAGEATLGAQLHPWVNPPFDEDVSERNSFVGNLPEVAERAKLTTLVGCVRKAFGKPPLVYRAGRYGVGPRSAALIEQAGFKLDVSVRALFDYRAAGGPDFSRHPLWPWWAGPRGDLLELPLGAAWTGALRRWGAPLYGFSGRVPRLRGGLDRAGLVGRVALTPEDTTLPRALTAIRRLLDDGIRAISFSFHSPSLEPGHTPYVRDAADLARFWAWWDGVLNLLAAEGVTPASAEQLVAAARETRGG